MVGSERAIGTGAVTTETRRHFQQFCRSAGRSIHLRSPTSFFPREPASLRPREPVHPLLSSRNRIIKLAMRTTLFLAAALSAAGLASAAPLTANTVSGCVTNYDASTDYFPEKVTGVLKLCSMRGRLEPAIPGARRFRATDAIPSPRHSRKSCAGENADQHRFSRQSPFILLIFNRSNIYFRVLSPSFLCKASATDGWTIEYHNSHKILTNVGANESYVLYQCGTPAPNVTGVSKAFAVPITKAAIADTTAVTYFEVRLSFYPGILKLRSPPQFRKN